MGVTISTAGVDDQVQTGYDLVADFALQKIPIFDQFTTMKTATTNQGSGITFHRWADLAETTTALNVDEVTDVSPVSLVSSSFEVTGLEYGSVTVTSAKLRSSTMLPGFSADQVTLVARTMAFSIDTLARTEMETSTQEDFIGTALNDFAATDILTADEVRQQHAGAVTANVQPLGTDYIWVLHPHVAYDLKSETGDGAFIAPAQYVNTDKVYNNEIGKFAGFKFVESNRCKILADQGTGSVIDAYWNYIFGADGVAKAVWTPPGLVARPPIDYLERLESLGWYAYLGYGIFRDEAMRLLIGASSMGVNA